MAEFVETTTIERTITCRFCGSTDLSKYGKYKDNQYYICKDCERKSSGTDAYPRMKYPKELNIKALTYYYNGMSCRKVGHTFDDVLDVSISKSTVWRWLIKFSRMGNQYVLSLRPQLSDVWLADETVVDLWGHRYWFWDIIDTRTRFLMATHLSKLRTTKDATKLFYMARLRSKTRPKKIITDGLQAYNKAFNKVFYSNIKARRVEHLTSHGFDSRVNINLIERFHGTIKQRTKVMRDLKKRRSARVILDGFITHYNFLMEHSSLDEATPATAGGIGDDIENWGDLIELALGTPRENPEVHLEWEEYFKIE